MGHFSFLGEVQTGPAREALQELEFGSVISIDEELLEGEGD